MIAKAAASAADAVCIDLEDSVPPDEKEASRANVVRAFPELDFGARVRMFRINALDTPFAYRDLIDVVEAAGDRIDMVMLPESRVAADVAFVDTLLTQIESHAASRGGSESRRRSRPRPASSGCARSRRRRRAWRR